VKLWFTKSVSTFVSVETVEPKPVTETTFFLVPENTFTCPSTIPRYVKGWARRGSEKKNKTKNLFIREYYKFDLRLKRIYIRLAPLKFPIWS